MINQEERDFYNGYYDKIKEMESDLVRRVSETIRNINQQSETKMVEHMTTRIKTKKSATEKLILAGYEPTADNAVSVLSDVLGIRLIVHFIGDIYTIRNILVNFGDIKVIKEKDYVRNAR
jgi:ppGpp synthetase/RelA/SpoT-type nucleotidyltranferase